MWTVTVSHCGSCTGATLGLCAWHVMCLCINYIIYGLHAPAVKELTVNLRQGWCGVKTITRCDMAIIKMA